MRNKMSSTKWMTGFYKVLNTAIGCPESNVLILHIYVHMPSDTEVFLSFSFGRASM